MMATDFLWLAGGVAAAVLYMAVLWASIVLFIGHGSAGALFVGMILRLGLLGCVAFGAVLVATGLHELAIGIAGFLLARGVVLKLIGAGDDFHRHERKGRV